MSVTLVKWWNFFQRVQMYRPDVTAISTQFWFGLEIGPIWELVSRLGTVRSQGLTREGMDARS